MGGNYEKSLFNQLQETMLAVEKLSAEISVLKKNHAAEIETLTQNLSFAAPTTKKSEESQTPQGFPALFLFQKIIANFSYF